MFQNCAGFLIVRANSEMPRIKTTMKKTKRGKQADVEPADVDEEDGEDNASYVRGDCGRRRLVVKNRG